MKSQKGVISPIIIVIIVLAVLIAGGVFAYPYVQPYIQKVIQKVEAPKDQTAGWKTYENKEQGYSFKYPQELLGFTGAENKTDDYIFGACNSEKSFCIFTNIIRIKQSSFSDFIDIFKKVNSKTIVSSYPKNILGKEAVVVEQDSGSEKSIYTFVNSDYPIVVSITTGGKKEIKIDDVNNQILSTFKFTK